MSASFLPEGQHCVCITKLETKASKSSAGEYISVTLVCATGDDKGKRHFDRITTVTASHQAITMGVSRKVEYIKATVGIPEIGAENTPTPKLEDAMFKPFIVTLAPQKTDPKRMQVKKVEPLPTDWTDVQRWAAEDECAKLADLLPTKPDVVPEPDWSLLRNGGQSAAPKLPLETFGAFGAFGGPLETLAKEARAPVDYVAFAFLTCVGALIGNSRPAMSDPQGSNWQEPIGFWTCLVGPPSSKKTPSIKPFQKILEGIEKADLVSFKRFQPSHDAKVEAAKQLLAKWKTDVGKALATGKEPPEKPPEAVVPAKALAPRTYTTDTTIAALAELLMNNPNGLLMLRDELAGWLNDMTRFSNSSDRPHWLQMYSGATIVVDRVKFEGEPQSVPNALMSVLGGIQPDKLKEVLNSPHDGLVERFLFIWPDPVLPTRSTVKTDTAIFIATFDRLRTLKGTFMPMRFSPQAADEFFEFVLYANKRCAEAHGTMAGWIGKGEGIVARLAVTFTLLDWAAHGTGPAPYVVEVGAVQRACELWAQYLLPMARRAFGDAARPVVERNAIALLKEIRKRKEHVVNTRAITHEWKLAGFTDAKIVDAALEYLVEAGWVFFAGRSTGGRPTKDWRVNFKLWNDDPA